MPDLSSSLRRVLTLLGQLNPLWIAALGALLLALVAGHSMRTHVQESARLQDRLTGSALVDALKSYAEASAPGQTTLPASVADLSDDNRGGHHRNWLDAASAEALADNSHWELLRDPDGHLRGARLKDNASAGSRWLPAWLGGGGPAGSEQVYGVDVHAPAPPPQVAETPPPSLPQPVMPDTPPPQPEVAAAVPPTPPAAPPSPILAAAPGEPRVLNSQVLDAKARASGTTPAAPGSGPSRILAGLAARQVLRLSGSGADEPVLTPRKAIPALPLPPRSAAVGTVRSTPATASGGATPAKPSHGKVASGKVVSGKIVSGQVPPARLPPSPTTPPSATAPIAAAGPLVSATPPPPPPPVVSTPIPSPVTPNTAPVNPPAGSVAARTPVRPIASGFLRRSTRPAPAAPGSPPDTPADPAAADAQAAAAAAAGAAAVSATGASGAPAVSATGAANAGPMPPATPPTRMDTVIYEDNQGAPSEVPKTDCRTMTGDSAECDAFEDSDPGLYQRCYQSLSERINACLAGEPVPPLVTR